MPIEATVSVERGAAFIVRCTGCGEQHTWKGKDLDRLKAHISALGKQEATDGR